MVSYGVPSCMGRYDLHGLEARVAFEMRFWFYLVLPCSNACLGLAVKWGDCMRDGSSDHTRGLRV
ncbi:hypothetical protein, partial [Helicobacter felis]|uniref:hypothetical protein n=1 Tax=Helicobacter felis TaxID=214 RepID=UPI001F2EF1AE